MFTVLFFDGKISIGGYVMKDKIMSNKELIVAIAVVLVFLATC